jgi:uncharacterized protein
VNRRLPSEEAAIDFLIQAGCSKRVIEHCRAVKALAVEIAQACKRRGVKVDVELVEIGALMHDVGRAVTHGVEHGVVGADIARNSHMPEKLVRIIERHIGGGLTSEEAQRLGLPVKSYVPVSLEERIVAYADKLIEGSVRLPVEVAVEKLRRDKNVPEASAERVRQWHAELSECLK